MTVSNDPWRAPQSAQVDGKTITGRSTVMTSALDFGSDSFWGGQKWNV